MGQVSRSLYKTVKTGTFKGADLAQPSHRAAPRVLAEAQRPGSQGTSSSGALRPGGPPWPQGSRPAAVKFPAAPGCQGP